MSCDCSRPRLSRLEFVKSAAALWYGFAQRRGWRRAVLAFAGIGAGLQEHFRRGGTLPCRAAMLEGMTKRIALEELPRA